jgi:DNA-binding transcriptional MerR regulator
MEWSIQEIARAAGTTSRTLRYYGEIGLLAPSRVGQNGYRFYDERALLRLQRILLLRELGLGIAEVKSVLAGEQGEVAALGIHLELLELERDRLDQLISTVGTTLRKLKGGEQLMPDEIFEGFDHARYRDEVVVRWGEDVWQRGDRWWSSLSDEEKQLHQQTQVEIAFDFAAALQAGEAADSEEVQAIADRHVQWLSGAVTPSREYLLGLGEMYVTDPRFAASYEKYGEGTAAFVREAMAVYADRNFA